MLALIRFEQRLLVLPDLKKHYPLLNENDIYRARTRLSNIAHLSIANHSSQKIKTNYTHHSKEHERSAHMGSNHFLTQLRAK